MKILNLTPHQINFYDSNNQLLYTIEPSGIVPRVKIESRKTNNINDLPIHETWVEESKIDIPEPQENTIYIVPRQVAEAIKDRGDLYIVDGAIRNNDNKIIGVTGLARIV